MSYHEKNSAMSLTTMLLLFGYYVLNMIQMVQHDALSPTGIFSLWLTVSVLGIIIHILTNIISYIAFHILRAVTTNEIEEEPTFADERDRLIALKGTRNSYAVFSIGAFIAMMTLVLGMSPLVMFVLLIFAALTAQVVGDISRLYLYRKGV